MRGAGALLARVGDPGVRVRRAAIAALGKLGGDDARAALLARWDAGDAPPDERRTLVEALGKLGGDDVPGPADARSRPATTPSSRAAATARC